MCMITLYKDSVKEENKIADEITKFKLDLASGKLTVFPMLKQMQEFKIARAITWDESNDSMVIE